MKMEQTECSETSAYKNQTLENYPEENTTKGFIFCMLHFICLSVVQYENTPDLVYEIRGEK
jgi:hypothetical protein